MERLREAGIELEMSSAEYALAMTGMGDTEGNIRRLAQALLAIDRAWSEAAGDKGKNMPGAVASEARLTGTGGEGAAQRPPFPFRKSSAGGRGDAPATQDLPAVGGRGTGICGIHLGVSARYPDSDSGGDPGSGANRRDALPAEPGRKTAHNLGRKRGAAPCPARQIIFADIFSKREDFSIVWKQI